MTNLIEKLHVSLSAYHDAEQEMITTNNRSYYVGSENDLCSYIWLRDPLSDVHLETVAGECLANPELCPNDFFAAVLREALGKTIPTGIDLQGLGIERTDNDIRFCISGSISLKELQMKIAPNHTLHDCEDEM